MPVSVERVAFSPPFRGKSLWMATLEGREGVDSAGGGTTKTLKFWRNDTNKYVRPSGADVLSSHLRPIINTQFPRPHGTSDLTAFAFGQAAAPTGSVTTYFLTASADGTARIWQLRQIRSADGELRSACALASISTR